MSEESENVRLIRQGYEAWNSGDRSWVSAHMTEDVVWTPPAEDLEVKPHVGVDAIQVFWEQWRAAVGDLHFEPLKIIDGGDDVVVMTRRSGKGVHSGLEVSDEVVQIFSFNEEGRCHAVREFYDRDNALGTLEDHQPETISDPDPGEAVQG